MKNATSVTMKEMKQMAPTTSELFVWNAAAKSTKMTQTAPIMSRTFADQSRHGFLLNVRHRVGNQTKCRNWIWLAG